MQSTANGAHFRELLLDSINAASNQGSVSFSPEDVMLEVITKLNATSDKQMKQAVLSYFNELLRTGMIGLGDTSKIKSGMPTLGGPPWPYGSAHVTLQGEQLLKHVARDPMNQTGYMAYLDQEVHLDALARSYLEEALKTYRACCYKATAVLIGAAVETLVLELRDSLTRGLTAAGKHIPKGLTGWQIKAMVEAIAKQILPDLKGEANRCGDGSIRRMLEEADSRLLPIAAEFRRLRNDAGHPASLDPVNPTDVHANLLLFPSTAKLLRSLTTWVAGFYR
jgi:hypothetical protein